MRFIEDRETEFKGRLERKKVFQGLAGKIQCSEDNRLAKLMESSSKEEHKENALALGAEEGRDKLR